MRRQPSIPAEWRDIVVIAGSGGHDSNQTTIPVVEEDHLIPLHARIALEDAGHEVLPAGNGEAAPAEAATRDDITAPFTDIALPGEIDGIGLATAIHRTHPGTAIVVASGLARPAADTLPAGDGFMARPYAARADVPRARPSTAIAVNTCAGRR